MPITLTADKSVRWATSKVIAVGSFPTKLTAVKGKAKYSRYEAFLSLGGFDSNTTYVMFARSDHEGEYGLAGGVIGHVTKGRHVLAALKEADKVLEVSPIVFELSSKDAFATTDLSTKLEDGMSVETHVRVKLDPRSPVSCEHFLVTVTVRHIEAHREDRRVHRQLDQHGRFPHCRGQRHPATRHGHGQEQGQRYRPGLHLQAAPTDQPQPQHRGNGGGRASS